MYCRTCLIFAILCVVFSEGLTVENTSKQRQSGRRFPDGFQFGTATSSYQIEGAWDVDGKSESIWDYQTHLNPSPIVDGSTGDDATKSYYLYKRDVEMLRELGYNIQPMVTLYHWDLPQKLQELGGWANPHSVDWFGDFAKVAFSAFGDRVKLWVTINEPTQICYNGYGNGQLAPFLTFSGVGDYMCAKYLLLAHARAYHIYNEEFRSTQQGSIFITFSAGWQEPATDEDVDAAQEAIAFDLEQYAYPIFSQNGGWNPLFKEIIAKKSAEQGFLRSRLPELSDEEIKYLQGSSDYFGLNHYSTYIISRNQSVSAHVIPSREDDLNVMYFQPSEWWVDEADTVKSTPWGFRKLLQYIREQYDNPPVYVTENGCSSLASIDDDNRVTYYRGYLGAMLDAIDEGSDVRGYTAWSLMDNFEWRKGYTEKFGIYEVDFTSPERTRTPRKSAFVFKEILRSRTLDYNYKPDTTVMTIDDGH